MTDWLWEVKECEEQRSNFLQARELGLAFFSRELEEKRYEEKRKKVCVLQIDLKF